MDIQSPFMPFSKYSGVKLIDLCALNFFSVYLLHFLRAHKNDSLFQTYAKISLTHYLRLDIQTSKNESVKFENRILLAT